MFYESFVFLPWSGYEGVFCQANINECVTLVPCLVGALCMDTPGGYKCQCPLGYAGQNCEVVSGNLNLYMLH